ncbi:hypothetical protein BDAP_001351 [Binucleata daphniae]
MKIVCAIPTLYIYEIIYYDKDDIKTKYHASIFFAAKFYAPMVREDLKKILQQTVMVDDVTLKRRSEYITFGQKMRLRSVFLDICKKRLGKQKPKKLLDEFSEFCDNLFFENIDQSMQEIQVSVDKLCTIINNPGNGNADKKKCDDSENKDLLPDLLEKHSMLTASNNSIECNNAIETAKNINDLLEKCSITTESNEATECNNAADKNEGRREGEISCDQTKTDDNCVEQHELVSILNASIANIEEEYRKTQQCETKSIQTEYEEHKIEAETINASNVDDKNKKNKRKKTKASKKKMQKKEKNEQIENTNTTPKIDNLMDGLENSGYFARISSYYIGKIMLFFQSKYKETHYNTLLNDIYNEYYLHKAIFSVHTKYREYYTGNILYKHYAIPTSEAYDINKNIEVMQEICDDIESIACRDFIIIKDKFFEIPLREVKKEDGTTETMLNTKAIPAIKLSNYEKEIRKIAKTIKKGNGIVLTNNTMTEEEILKEMNMMREKNPIAMQNVETQEAIQFILDQNKIQDELINMMNNCSTKRKNKK